MQDARRGLGEQNKQARGQDDSNGGSNELGDELIPRLRTQEVPGLQIICHIGGLCGGAGSDDTSGQVERARWVSSEMCGFADTTEDELGGLGDSGDGIEASSARGLNDDEGEKETENEGEDGFADVHVELKREDGAAHGAVEDEAGGPPGRGDAVLKGCLVLIFRVESIAGEP